MTNHEYELVTEHVEITVDDEPRPSAMGAHLARPAGPGSYPGVVIGFQLFGLTSSIREVTERVAKLGYVAIAPDYHHRTAPGVELAADDAGRARGFELMDRLTRDEVLRDTGAAISYLREHAGAGPRTGMVGFSLGGHIAYLTATGLDLAATAVLYGGWLPTTDIPLSRPEPTLDLTPASPSTAAGCWSWSATRTGSSPPRSAG